MLENIFPVLLEDKNVYLEMFFKSRFALYHLLFLDILNNII